MRTLMLLLLAGLAGCQSYKPQPLDLAAHGRIWRSRDATSETVVAYARDLEQRGVVATRYDPADGLALAEAEPVALLFNPGLRAARLRARVTAAGAAEAGRWEDPELGIDAERIISGVDDPWVLGGMLSITLPLSGRLSLEKDKALAQADMERLKALGAERKAIADLREAWLEWSANVERAALARDQLEALEAAATTAEKLRAAGELDSTDARVFAIERATRQAQLREHDAAARVGEMHLKSRLGLTPQAPVTLVPALGFALRNPNQAGLVSTPFSPVDWQHPRMLIARAEYEVAERALRLEIQKQYPDLKIGGGFGTDEGDERILGGLSLPLPLWNANRRAIAEARATREAARAEAESVHEQLAADLAEAQLRLGTASDRMAFVDKELAPLVDEQLRTVRQLGRMGDASTLLLLEALKSAYDAKLQVIEVRLAAARAAARIESLLERPIAADPTLKEESR